MVLQPKDEDDRVLGYIYTGALEGSTKKGAPFSGGTRGFYHRVPLLMETQGFYHRVPLHRLPYLGLMKYKRARSFLYTLNWFRV